MKKMVLMLVLLASAVGASVVFAETPKDRGPETIDLKMGDAKLHFSHWKHQDNLNKECFHCHNTKIGKIDGWSKQTAHDICIACHDLEDKGPVNCRQCHTKKKTS